MYHHGFDGKEPNYVEAAYWYRKSADQGNARAQYAIGKLIVDILDNAAAGLSIRTAGRRLEPSWQPSS